MKWVRDVRDGDVSTRFARGIPGYLSRTPLIGAAAVLWLTASTVAAADGTSNAVRFSPVRSAADPAIDEFGAGGALDRPDSIYGEEDNRVPQIVEGHFQLPELTAPTTETEKIGNGTAPEGFRGQQSAPRNPLPETRLQAGQPAEWKIRPWAAPNTFANPRYFEDRMLERHGHERFGHFQPLASGVRFFATVPMLPYLATIKPPHDCEYMLGYYRVGSCVPLMLQRPPYERRAAAVEAASVAGAIIIFP